MRILFLLLNLTAAACAQAPLKLGIAGLTHGHAQGFLRALEGRTDVVLVGVSDPDAQLRQQYASRFKLDAKILYPDLNAMLEQAKPDAVAAFSSTFDHPVVVEACARKKLPVMMEKPLAVSMEHARRIERAAKSSGIPVIVNYETTWYKSHGAIEQLVKRQALGEIRKIVAMDGHSGPKEIGVGPEFLGWLTDPEKNGAGALFDFGCYGANLMTWLLNNQRPVAVTATTLRIKPENYPRVDDEADILVEYPKTIGIIQGSWNWPFSRKDLEVYGRTGYAIATGGNVLRTRLAGAKSEETRAPEPLPAPLQDPVSYLAAVARGTIQPSGLSSLENNLIVTEILVAARESARTGRRVLLK